jgi:hypothetical protein
MAPKGWKRPFDEPIPLPDGGELRTLLDAGRYVDKLPRSMHEREEWQTVMEVLLSAVEGGEPVSLLRIEPPRGSLHKHTYGCRFIVAKRVTMIETHFPV